MHRHVAILKDLCDYHRRGPEKSTDDRVGRAWPNADDSKSDLDRSGNRISRHHLTRLNSRSIANTL